MVDPWARKVCMRKVCVARGRCRGRGRSRGLGLGLRLRSWPGRVGGLASWLGSGGSDRAQRAYGSRFVARAGEEGGELGASWWPRAVFARTFRSVGFVADGDDRPRLSVLTPSVCRPTVGLGEQFVDALARLNNVGAVGPLCRQGNTRILTHDFTHKVCVGGRSPRGGRHRSLPTHDAPSPPTPNTRSLPCS
jgi:hypothetical protein